ncbi:MAG: polysaccharide biosynthesis tyrosine autokinase [Planctomycetes bacterium]|nr:polysaccharide biosynthesis tyrosine autokinase [Planctomycetota bacterium]
MRNNDATNVGVAERMEIAPLPGTTDDLLENLQGFLWRRLWIVLLPVILALLMGGIYQSRATPLYTSTSKIYVEQIGPPIFQGNVPGVVTRWPPSYLNTQAEVLRSTGILSAALQSPALADLPDSAKSANSVGALRRGLNVEMGKKDEIINVSFTSPFPEEAAAVVRAVVEAYVEAQNKHKTSLSAEAVRILGEERTKRETELNDKRQALTDFERKNEDLVFGTGRDTNVIARSLEHLRLLLTEADIATLDSQAFYDTCKRLMDRPSRLREYAVSQRNRGGDIPAAGQVAGLQAELKRLERERADYLLRLKPDTPAIVALGTEISQLKQQILDLDKEFAKTQLAVAEEELQAAQERQKALESLFEQHRQDAVTLSNQLGQYDLLQSDYERTRTFCNTLDDRIRVLGVDPQVGSLDVQIVEAAQTPTSPSRPRLPKTMGLALCLGLFFGMGLALNQEWKDKRLRSTEEISDLLELPILGVIPSMTSPNQTAVIRGQKVRVSPGSREAEAFRGLRTTLFHWAPKGKAWTILVTSAAAKEGKSTVVGNLAITMAHAGQRVVVVDANLRRPEQHILFNMDPKGKGLTSVVAGRMSLEEAIAPTKIGNLDILASGPAVSNPAEVIDSEDFAQVLKQLADEYDRVIVDSPAVLAVTDAQILASRCDATVLVIRAQASSRKLSLQAHHRLASVDARILGVVVNDVQFKGADYGYCSHYDYRRDADSSELVKE